MRQLRLLIGTLVTVGLLAVLAVSPAYADPPFDPPGLASAIAAQEAHTNALLGVRGVVGTAVGLTADGDPAVLIFTETPGVAGLPRSLDGVPVVVQATGNFFALHHCKGKHAEDPACAPAPPPDDDGIDPNDVIGQLSDFESIVFSTTANNTIDAAIAVSSEAVLGNATPSDGYRMPKSAIVSAAIWQAVQKYGRTTSLTKGTITDINATLKIGYPSGTARFVDQIIVQSTKHFLKSGDSGSLLVTDPDRNPVGLLFAGNRSGKLAVANRIDWVLDAFGVSIDGE